MLAHAAGLLPGKTGCLPVFFVIIPYSACSVKRRRVLLFALNMVGFSICTAHMADSCIFVVFRHSVIFCGNGEGFVVYLLVVSVQWPVISLVALADRLFISPRGFQYTASSVT